MTVIVLTIVSVLAVALVMAVAMVAREVAAEQQQKQLRPAPAVRARRERLSAVRTP